MMSGVFPIKLPPFFLLTETYAAMFHREPLDQVVAVVDWVLSEQETPGYDLEGMLIKWAIEHSAGVYGPNRREGDLTRLGEILERQIAYGDLYWIETERPGLTHAEKYRIYLKRLHDKEMSIGRSLTPSERDQFTRDFYAVDYRKDLKRISEEQWQELRDELENRNPRTD